MQTGKQKIDFFKKDFEEYMKKARENDDYLSKISNGLRAGNQNQIFLLSDNFIAFEYYKDKSWNNFKLIAFAYGLSKKNKKGVRYMSIYKLKSRNCYIEKSFDDENFRENILSGMRPGIDIFLIDEYFNPISVMTKSPGHLATVNIYKPIKDDSNESTILKSRNFYQMTIGHGRIGTKHSNDFPEVIIRKFLNSYLNSEQESRKIKRIKDRMSFLAYVIEYK